MTLSDNLSTTGSVNALKMANRNRIYRENTLIHHSDRGIQYCSDAYQNLLERCKRRTGITESYDPYANAVAERVNGILKQEFILEEINLPLKDMKKVIRNAVNTYNNKRPHFSCGYVTPQKMHEQDNFKIKTYKNKDFCKASLAEM